jgi:hypothetical protein
MKIIINYMLLPEVNCPIVSGNPDPVAEEGWRQGERT